MISIQPDTRAAYRLMHDGILTLAEIERAGIRIDMNYCKRQMGILDRKIERLVRVLRETRDVKEWRQIYGDKFNLESPRQLADYLYEHRGLIPAKTTEKGNASVDDESLKSIKEPFVQDLLRIRKLKKARDTYLKGILSEVSDDGLLHPFFNLHTVKTYRSSSSAPNFQNLPIRDKEMGKIIRRAFLPRPGHRFGGVDYSGIEVRIACTYHHDATMVEYIWNPFNDMHRDMAMECYKLRHDQVNKASRYCNPGEAPIWMWDGSFKRADEVKVGDTVFGWRRAGKKIVEHGKSGNSNNRKRTVAAKVTAINKRRAAVVKVTMASGRVIRCTADHLWLDGISQLRSYNWDSWKHQKGHKVIIGREIFRPATVGRCLAHVVDPVPDLPLHLIRPAGYLAGIYDGEGSDRCISQSLDHNPEVCKAIEWTLKALGIPFTTRILPYGSGDISKRMMYFNLGNGIQARLMLLNYCKPVKNKKLLESIRQRSSIFHRDRVMKIEPDGVEDVYGLTTTTGNYIAWGYASKNCAKNKFVFPQFYGDWYKSCAVSLWSAIDEMELQTADGVPMREHLCSQGLQNYNRFEQHIKQVEDRFWNERFPVYAAWKDEWVKAYERTGQVRMLTGFTCSGVMRRNEVLNVPIQGSAFHCLLWSLIRLHDWLKREKMQTKIVGQIHDEISMDSLAEELDTVLKRSREIMCEEIRQEWKWIVVPLHVESSFAPTDRSWYEKETV